MHGIEWLLTTSGYIISGRVLVCSHHYTLNQSNHAVVIPLYGDLPNDWSSWTTSLVDEGFLVVLVENNSELQADSLDSQIHSSHLKEHSGLHILYNKNKGGVAGGFNRGVHYAIGMGIQWVTLLDQDSRLSPVLIRRLMNLGGICEKAVGWTDIWDGRRWAPWQAINEELETVSDYSPLDQFRYHFCYS